MDTRDIHDLISTGLLAVERPGEQQRVDAAQRLNRIADEIDDAFTPLNPQPAMCLAEYAIEKCLELYRRSHLYFLDIHEGFNRLLFLHARACMASNISPEVLGTKLLDWHIKFTNTRLDYPLTLFPPAFEGEVLAAYRKEALRLWHNLSTEQRRSAAVDSLADVVLSAAKAIGDAETAIAVQSRVLESTDHYVKLARLYVQFGRTDEAIALLERGVALFPGPVGAALFDRLARINWSVHRFDKALEAIWSSFRQSNSLEVFQDLKSAAERTGQWPEYRQRMIQHFQNEHSDCTAIVEMYLSEGQFEDAWRHVAGACDEFMRLKLAEASEALFPERALAAYRSQIESSCHEGSIDEYFDEDIADWFRGVGRIMCSRGDTEGFKAYARESAAHFTARPVLLKILNGLAEL